MEITTYAQSLYLNVAVVTVHTYRIFYVLNFPIFFTRMHYSFPCDPTEHVVQNIQSFITDCDRAVDYLSSHSSVSLQYKVVYSYGQKQSGLEIIPKNLLLFMNYDWILKPQVAIYNEIQYRCMYTYVYLCIKYFYFSRRLQIHVITL